MGPVIRRKAALAGVAAASLVLAACSTVGPRWHAVDVPGMHDATRLFLPEGVSGAMRPPYPSEIPVVPPRINLRPCCAFGAQLRVRVGPVPIPWYFMGNLVDRQRIRHHIYDNGIATLGQRGDDPNFLHSEGNGLVYTCRGGFLDIAHVRDYADTTLYLATLLARHLESGGTFELPEEGGRLSVRLTPFAERRVAKEGRWAIAIPLAQWLSQQVSIWHEIATWFGWSTFPLFPEEVSSFSPEDLYSNLLGARIGAAVLSQHGGADEFAYNRNVDAWLDQALVLLDAVPVEVAEEAMLSVEGLWWDSTRRLPDPELVRRRNFEDTAVLEPWLVPASRRGPKLLAACGAEARPLGIANPDALGAMAFADHVTLTVEVPDDMSEQEPFATIGGRVTQADFPRILEWLRQEARRRYGPEADRPNGMP